MLVLSRLEWAPLLELGLRAGLLPCNKYGFAQIQNLTGRWVDSPKEDFNGFYTMLTDCPSWVREYDCKNPSLTGDTSSLKRAYADFLPR